MRHKCTPPALPVYFLSRPALLHALEQGKIFKSQLLQGGAASGKSTLIMDWLQKSELQFNWFTLDQSDQDPVRLLIHFFESIQNRWPSLSFAAAEMHSSLKPHSASLRPFIAALADDLARQHDTPTVLVFDDAHFIDHDAEILNLLADFARYLPDHFHLLFSSHPTQSPEWLIQSAQGDLWMHSADLLMFSQTEIQDLVALRQISLAPTIIEQLHNKSQGWAGGLVLLIQMMLTQVQDPGQWLEQRASDQLIFSYYVRLLTQRDAEFEGFLLQIAYVPLMEKSQCQQLFSELPVQDYLDRIFQLKLFISLIPGLGMSFTPALRNYLQQTFVRQYPPQQQRDFFAKLAHSLEYKEPEQAFEYYLKASLSQDAQRVFQTIQGAYFDQQSYGKLQDMLSALESTAVFPRELELLRADLLRLQGQLEPAQLKFQSMGATDPEVSIYLAAIACQKGELQKAVSLAKITLPTTAALQTRALQANLLGVCYLMQHQAQQALQAFQQAFDMYQQLSWPGHQAKVMHNEGLAYTWLGQLNQARQAYLTSLNVIAENQLLAPPMTSHNLAIIHMYLGEFEQAQVLLEQAQTRSQKLGLITEQVYTLATLGRLYSRLNQAEQAYHYLERCQKWVDQYRHPSLRQFTQLIQLEHALRTDDLAKAKVLIDGHFEQTTLSELEDLEWRIRRAEFWLISKNHSDARQALIQLKASLEQLNYRFYLARVLFLLAQSETQLGYVQQAEKASQNALQLCQHENYQELQKEFQSQIVSSKPVKALEAAYKIQLFGKIMLWHQGKLIGTDVWGGKKVRLLLALLLIREQGLEWQEIAEYLSPDEDMKRASVNTAIARLRKALEVSDGGTQVVLFTEGRYRLNPSWHTQVDLQHFNYCYQQAQSAGLSKRQNLLEQTILTYQQALLKEFEELVWVQWEQEHVRKYFRRCCLQLFEIVGSQPPQLLDWAEKAIRQDKVFEEAHLAKLNALEQIGNRRGIVQHMKQMSQIYQKELGLPPPEEALIILKRVQH